MDTPLPPEFQACADAVSRISAPISDEQRLQFYALYKQATQGACTGARPGFFDFVGKAKWDAWNSLGNLSRAEAASRYISIARQLIPEGAVENLDLDQMTVSKPKAQKGMGAVFSRPEAVQDAECPKDLCFWAQANNVAEVNKLLAQGVKIDAPDEEQRTALMWACDRGNLEMAELLIKAGAQLSAKDKEGQTPLHYAVLTGEKGLVSLLLRHGVDKTLTDNEGLTAADLAEGDELKALLK